MTVYTLPPTFGRGYDDVDEEVGRTPLPQRNTFVFSNLPEDTTKPYEEFSPPAGLSRVLSLFPSTVRSSAPARVA